MSVFEGDILLSSPSTNTLFSTDLSSLSINTLFSIEDTFHHST